MVLQSRKKLVFMKNDKEIIQGIQAGGLQRQRWESLLFEQFRYFIREGQQQHALKEEEVQSAYCDAFMILVEKIADGRFRADAGLKTFFYRIFHNKCVDAARKNSTNRMQVHQTEEMEDWERLSGRAVSVVKSLIQKESVAEMYAAFARLGKQCKEILTAWAKGYSAKEIAKSLGYKTDRSVRTTKMRCMDKLVNLK